MGVEHLEYDAAFTVANGSYSALEETMDDYPTVSVPNLTALSSSSSLISSTSLGHTFAAADPITRDNPPRDVLYISADALLGDETTFNAWVDDIVETYVPQWVRDNYFFDVGGQKIDDFSASFVSPKSPVPIIYVTNPKRIDVWNPSSSEFESVNYRSRSTYDADGQVVRNKNENTTDTYFTRMETLKARGIFKSSGISFISYTYFEVQQSFTDALLSYNFFTADASALTTSLLRDLDFRKAIDATEIGMNDSDGQVTSVSFFNEVDYIVFYVEFKFSTSLTHTIMAFGDIYSSPYVFALGLNASDQLTLHRIVDGSQDTTVLDANTVSTDTWHSLYVRLAKSTDFTSIGG